MFENYLQDASVYQKLERHFVDLFQSKIGNLEKHDTPYTIGYYNTKFSNGVPFRNGNPIFSVKNEQIGSLLIIIIDEVDNLVSYDSTASAGVERVVIGNIHMLHEINAKLFEWLDEQP
ncbi:hypothetical protein VLK31_15540 [Variovorax sp. H27-G14]|uniref:hypothetical protein n=1 Tax=Variovorax sp. H27-G14 TaxID=3111914 RepID=UPI0038FD2194